VKGERLLVGDRAGVKIFPVPISQRVAKGVTETPITFHFSLFTFHRCHRPGEQELIPTEIGSIHDIHRRFPGQKIRNRANRADPKLLACFLGVPGHVRTQDDIGQVEILIRDSGFMLEHV
jgi:hypothetical protein